MSVSTVSIVLSNQLTWRACCCAGRTDSQGLRGTEEYEVFILDNVPCIHFLTNAFKVTSTKLTRSASVRKTKMF